MELSSLRDESFQPCNNLKAERYFSSGVQSLKSLYKFEIGLGVETFGFFLGYLSLSSGMRGSAKYWYKADSEATNGSVSGGRIFA